jgi:hypothetical protein
VLISLFLVKSPLHLSLNSLFYETKNLLALGPGAMITLDLVTFFGEPGGRVEEE